MRLLAIGILSVFLFAPVSAANATGPPLEVFAGSASKPAVESAARRFELQTGIRVFLHLGGSGAMLSQMKLARRGDVYLPGSSDFMEVAKRLELVVPGTEARVAYLLPAINVPRGNPKNIRSVEDLARPGLRVGIARPDTVCVGLYAIEALEGQGLLDRVRPNFVGFAESCVKTAQLLALGLVDAVLGWDVFEHWNPQAIQTIPLLPGQVPRIGYIPAAVSSVSRQPETAQAFIDFLTGPEGQSLFKAAGYVSDLAEVQRRAGLQTPVGGEYSLPESWRRTSWGGALSSSR